MDIAGFAKVAQYLTHPLVLVGFVLMLAYGIHWQLMKSGLLSKVDKKDSGIIIRLFLRYGFWLALILLLAGFALPVWNKYMDTVKIISIDAQKTAENLLKGQLDKKDEQIKALTKAIAALSKTGAPAASINDALQALEQGNTAKAQAIFAKVLKTREAEGKQANREAAEAARHLGALAFMNNPKEALIAYQKAVELDPDNADSWNMLGILLIRTGEPAQAEAAYRRVQALGEAHQDREAQAAALGNIGVVYKRRGELYKAEEMYRKGLELDQVLGRKEGMAAKYSNLGLVYKRRGELDKAEEMCRKAIELYQALVSKEGMAGNYANLGGIYKQRGNLDQAEAAWQKSLNLYQEMDALQHPNAKLIQQWLDELAKKKAGSSR